MSVTISSFFCHSFGAVTNCQAFLCHPRIGSQTNCQQRSRQASSSSSLESEASEAGSSSDAEPAVSVDKALMGEIHRTGQPYIVQTAVVHCKVPNSFSASATTICMVSVCRCRLFVQNALRDEAPDSAGGQGGLRIVWSHFRYRLVSTVLRGSHQASTPVTQAECHIRCQSVSVLLQGHRTLVFSQSRVMLDILQIAIVAADWSFLRLDGSVSSAADRAVGCC